MKAYLQRVSQATVTVEQSTVGTIQQGLLVFLGVTHEDQAQQAKWLANKCAHLRIFPDEHGKMNCSASDLQLSALVVSQFTLYADCTRGRRPDFIQAADPHIAKQLYLQFIEHLKEHLPHVEQGSFGAAMHVSLVNEGPATFLIESKN